jgi:hypothetical protein
MVARIGLAPLLAFFRLLILAVSSSSDRLAKALPSSTVAGIERFPA